MNVCQSLETHSSKILLLLCLDVDNVLMSPYNWEEDKLAENVRKKRNIWIIKTFCSPGRAHNLKFQKYHKSHSPPYNLIFLYIFYINNYSGEWRQSSPSYCRGKLKRYIFNFKFNLLSNKFNMDNIFCVLPTNLTNIWI